MSNRKLKVIYSLNLHLALQELGFVTLTEMKNPNNPRFICWVYEDTEKFHKEYDRLLVERGAFPQ